MKARVNPWTICVAVFAAVLPLRGAPPQERDFELGYVAKIEGVPEGARRVDLWLPYPESDEHQEILDASVSAPAKVEIREEPEYGNSIVHLTIEAPGERDVEVSMRFRVKRREYLRKDFPQAASPRGELPAEVAKWLEPDHLVPLSERIQKLAAEVTKGKETDLQKARAIYDYVVSTMKYDKSGTGWGNGDIYWACDAKRGNCTDFHALFIGLSRAVGIPAKFAIGFPLPLERGQGEIGGYHCWAEFYLAGYGWVPVDTSEAAKHPEKREYFFGAHDENRVQLSIGRDVVLAPRQAGEPLNYFIYPYAEVDGKPWKQVAKSFRYQDTATGPAAGAQGGR